MWIIHCWQDLNKYSILNNTLCETTVNEHVLHWSNSSKPGQTLSLGSIHVCIGVTCAPLCYPCGYLKCPPPLYCRMRLCPVPTWWSNGAALMLYLTSLSPKSTCWCCRTDRPASIKVMCWLYMPMEDKWKLRHTSIMIFVGFHIVFVFCSLYSYFELVKN